MPSTTLRLFLRLHVCEQFRWDNAAACRDKTHGEAVESDKTVIAHIAPVSLCGFFACENVLYNSVAKLLLTLRRIEMLNSRSAGNFAIGDHRQLSESYHRQHVFLRDRIRRLLIDTH